MAFRQACFLLARDKIAQGWEDSVMINDKRCAERKNTPQKRFDRHGSTHFPEGGVQRDATARYRSAIR
jgi:hypothetical protein